MPQKQQVVAIEPVWQIVPGDNLYLFDKVQNGDEQPDAQKAKKLRNQKLPIVRGWQKPELE
jgi:hypothetical protein